MGQKNHAGGSLVACRRRKSGGWSSGWKLAGLLAALPASATPVRSLETCVTHVLQRQGADPAERGAIRERLQEAYATPLNLHQATPETLGALGILSEEQIACFFAHLRATGPLHSIYELQAIPAFDLETIYLLRPFVYVPAGGAEGPTEWWDRSTPGRRHRVWWRYASPVWTDGRAPSRTQEGARQLGKGCSHAVGLLLQPNRNSTLGFVARTQAGEAAVWDPSTHRYGFNLWSFFLCAERKPYLKRLLIGDYRLGCGQGLLLQGGFPVQSAPEGGSVVRTQGVGIQPYKGIRRIGWRGIAAATAWKAFEATGFCAAQRLDGTVALDGQGRPYAQGTDATGRYATPHALQKKGKVGEGLLGCVLVHRAKQTQRETGFAWVHHRYAVPILPKPTPWNGSAFRGTKATAVSCFGCWPWRNLLFFGEAARSFPDGAFGKVADRNGWLAGTSVGLSRRASGSLVLYRYGAGFYNPYGQGFKKYTAATANERGGYGCVQWAPWFHGHFSADLHLFAHVGPTAALRAVLPGARTRLRARHTHRRETAWGAQYAWSCLPKRPTSAQRGKGIGGQERAAWAVRQRVKLAVDRKWCARGWMGFAGQWVRHAFWNETRMGYALLHQQQWKWAAVQCRLQGIYFDAPHAATRLYFREPAPLYGGTRYVPYLGRGVAVCGLLCWKPVEALRLEGKWRWMHRRSLPELAGKDNGPGRDRCANENQGLLQVVWHF